MERFTQRFRRNRQPEQGMPAQGMPSEMPDVEGMSGARTSEQQEQYEGTSKGFARDIVNRLMPNRAVMPAEDNGTGRKIGEKEILVAERKLKEFKGGKASVEHRIKECQQWWKLKNWEQIELERGTRGCTVKRAAQRICGMPSTGNTRTRWKHFRNRSCCRECRMMRKKRTA